MVVTPNSTIKLYKNVDVCSGQKLVFSTLGKRKNYFDKRLVKQFNECTIVKHQTGMIRLDIPGSLAATCNYMSFRNPSFSANEIFCNISMIPEYTNNECTQLAYEIDYWTSFYNEVNFDDMYIDREHLSVSKYNLSQSNPYHESLWEFRTNEPLAISKDTEQLHFDTYDASNNYRPLFKTAAEMVSYSNLNGGMMPGTMDIYYDLIYMSDIDFETLDEMYTPPGRGGISPSEEYASFFGENLDFSIDYSRSGNPFKSNGRFGYILGTSDAMNRYVTNDYQPGYKVIALASKIYDTEKGTYRNRPSSKSLTKFLGTLTQWGVLSSVINIYRVPSYVVRAMFSWTNMHNLLQYTAHIPRMFMSIKPPYLDTCRNKKLLNYPYSYLRLLSPMGEDVKELHYEKFLQAAEWGFNLFESQDKVQIGFGVSFDISENPKMIVFPLSYEYYHSKDYGGDAFDGRYTTATLRNAMIYDKIPTAPYTIDSWLAQMSANAQNIIANNTTEYQYQMGQEHLAITSQEIQNRYAGVNVVGQAIGAGVSLATGNVAGAVSGVVNAVSSAEQAGVNRASADLARQSLQNRADMSDSAYAALAGDQDGNAVFENFKYTRPAYAANKYVAPTGDGVLNYHPAAEFDITLRTVSLNPYVFEQYDKWFDNYGYASGRCGIPYVVNFAQGITDASKIPHFAKMSNGKYATYVKTNDCKVTHTQAIVSNSIKNLFDNGVRFIKGDNL